MYRFSANDWEDYDVYIAKKRAKAKRIEKKAITKKEKQKKLKDHNSTVKGIAKSFVRDMQAEPSALEKRMIDFLDSYNVKYQFQKPLYLKKTKGIIKKFYIVDFYVPSKNLIIETDGKFHDNQIRQDAKRTKDIHTYFPNMKVFRWRWHDFESPTKLRELIENIT